MDFIDCFRGGDIVFPDAESFRGTYYTGILDKSESIAGSGGGTHNMGGTEAGMDHFRCRNRLDNGFTPAPAKNKQDVPVLIRLMIRHANSPGVRAWNTSVVRTPLCCAAQAVDVLWHPEHCALHLRQDARDPTR